jgi:hypothetical protein
LHFRQRKFVLSAQQDFLTEGCALDGGQRMSDWCETLASIEALAAVIIIVVVGAGASLR